MIELTSNVIYFHEIFIFGLAFVAIGFFIGIVCGIAMTKKAYGISENFAENQSRNGNRIRRKP